MPAFDRVMMLCRRKFMLGAGLAQNEAVTEPERVGCSQFIGIESNTATNPTCFPAAISEMKCDRIFRLAGLNPNWRCDLSSPEFEFNNVAGF